ncbi:MAG: hypothetical protein U5L07_09325 [Desulfobacterales bacterium]|nr:hypothetical protein [Desulfobacterales bacterium]
MTEDQKQSRFSLFFDQRDHGLLEIVNEMLAGDISHLHAQRRFFHYLHPRGIKEMAESRGLRIAYAVIHLLESLEGGEVENRLCALRALRDEVMCSDNRELQINTARVLIEIMKELVRAHGNYARQLQLAHDFRVAASGKSRIVRGYLNKYHLLEMPEEWNQLAFDDHVHDASTKGRKSATHLIMDAWIKGIRRLRVIYYNFIRPETAEELIEAADIMGILVRIGIEFSVSFHGRYVQLIWVPRGFADADDFIRFLSRNAVDNLMNDGGEVSDYQRNYVLAILDQFNRKHRHSINDKFDLHLPALDVGEFLSFVGIGQASLLHLAKFIHAKLLPLMSAKAEALRRRYPNADAAEQQRMAALVDEMDQLDLQAIHDKYLKADQNPEVPDIKRADIGEPPALMQHSPAELIRHLAQFHLGYRITLNLTNVEPEDVLELLYDCQGMITRLEIFNLKDYADGKVRHIPAIHDLQRCINSGNVIKLKRIILEMIDRLEEQDDAVSRERVRKFRKILANTESFKTMYKIKELKPRMGSDSTGYSPRHYGMGLAVMDSLPRRARREVFGRKELPRLILPFHVDTALQVSYINHQETRGALNSLLKGLRWIPGLRYLGREKRKNWMAMVNASQMVPAGKGNIVTLGGVQTRPTNRLSLSPPKKEEHELPRSWRYIQSTLKNFLKVGIGFIPAFLTFLWTHEWWILMYFGAVIWFAITGLRNIVQSVMGGGGIRRSSLLRWNDFISWDRLADSLLFTGFSVPLLDYLVKTIVLDQGFAITTSTSPATLYAIMAIANGIYLSSHNMFRGLPKEAAIWNFFRSILSIPVAFGFNAALGGILGLAGVAGVNAILQTWAAVISKFASDCVAGVIEGTVDRSKNIQNRISDYRQKLNQFLDVYARLEMIFPEDDVYNLLDRPMEWYQSADENARDLIKILIINALDLLYFWMYQPRARTAFRDMLWDMAPDERCVLIKAQSILRMEREISQMFIDGIVGRHFSKPLAFYLSSSGEYLKAIDKLNAAFEDYRVCA